MHSFFKPNDLQFIAVVGANPNNRSLLYVAAWVGWGGAGWCGAGGMCGAGGTGGQDTRHKAQGERPSLPLSLSLFLYAGPSHKTLEHGEDHVKDPPNGSHIEMFKTPSRLNDLIISRR